MSLQHQQWALTRHLRDPARVPAPEGLEARGLQVYRELLFNNLQGLLAGSFPVLLQVLDTDEWEAMCRRYFVEHRCRTPLFTEVAGEFVEWLQAQPGLPRPFLAELAHYEWVELALQGHQASALPTTALDPWQVHLRRSALAWPLLYEWPVQSIGRDCQPTRPGDTPVFLLARREGDGRIVFSQLSALAWQLLEQIEALPGHTGQAHVARLATRNGLEPAALADPGRSLLWQMQAAGVIGPVADPTAA